MYWFSVFHHCSRKMWYSLPSGGVPVHLAICILLWWLKYVLFPSVVVSEVKQSKLCWTEIDEEQNESKVFHIFSGTRRTRISLTDLFSCFKEFMAITSISTSLLRATNQKQYPTLTIIFRNICWNKNNSFGKIRK